MNGFKKGTKLTIRPFPINAIKKLMRRDTDLQLSNKGLVLISEHLEDYLRIITQQAVDELERTNRNPNRPHYVYTRLSDGIIKRVLNRLEMQMKNNRMP
ncbi:MAG: histone-like protein [Candidatus Hodarchaeota archaeon]